jgi:hypothetical protein
MPFRLATAAARFQNMIKEIFQDLIDQEVVVYIDHILIYSMSQEEYEKLIKEILSSLQK